MQSPVVAGLRKQYPGYDDIADEDFVTAIHGAHYNDMSEEDFLQSMDDAYNPAPIKPAMKPGTHWANNAVNALGDAAKSMPMELWKDVAGIPQSAFDFAKNAQMEQQNKSLPSETPGQLRARGYNPKQVRNVLAGNVTLRQQQSQEQLDATKLAQENVARGAAFAITAPLGEGMFAKGAIGAAIKNPIARHAILGALGVGGYSGIKTGITEGSLENVPKEAAIGAVMGAGMGPIFHRALNAAGSVMSIPKNIVAGYNEASVRIAAQAEASGRAIAQSFVDKWVSTFNPHNIRNFPEVHNALGAGTITPDEAAGIILDNSRSSLPGGFLDDKVVTDPATRARLQGELGKKLGKWWLANPSARLQLRTMPRPEIPLTETAGNAIPDITNPEPNVIGSFREQPASTLSQQQVAAQALDPNTLPGPETPMAPEPMPIEGNALTGPSSAGLEPGVVDLPGAVPAEPLPQTAPVGLEGNAPPAPTPLTIEGAALQQPAQPPYNVPPSTIPPLGVQPGPALEPNLAGQLGGDLQGAGQAVQKGTPPGTPLDVQNPVPTLEGAQTGATAATEAPTLEPNQVTPVNEAPEPTPTGRDMSMTTAIGGRIPAPGSLAASLAGPTPSPRWQEFIDALGPETGRDIFTAIEKDLTPVAENLTHEPAPPAPGRWHQIDMFADANIAAAKARMDKRGVRLNMFIDPADVADISIIGANYMLKGALTLAEWSTHMVAEFGDGIKPHLERLYGEAKAVFESRRPEGTDEARLIAADYLKSIGLGPGNVPAWNEFSSLRGRKVADAYNQMVDVTTSQDPATRQSAVNSYKALTQEVREQYQHLVDSGVTIEFVDGRDPYPNQLAMSNDVKNGHLFVSNVARSHDLLPIEDANKLHAVFDYFGHGAEGYPYGPRGEENAWYNHARMFSDDAIPAFTTETRGQNSVGYRDGIAAVPKAGLLPAWTYEDIIKGRQRATPKLAAGNPRGKNTFTQNLDVTAKALTLGVSRTSSPKTQQARALADGMSGIPEWLARNPNSKTWYSKSIDDMMEQTVAEIPSLANNPAKQRVFKLFLAVSSQGNKPAINYDYATKMFEGYEKTGRMPMLGRTGQEQGMFGRSAAPKFAALLKQFNGDEAAMVEYLTSKDAKGRYNVVQEFGPKIGRFFLNLDGVPTEVTVDRWINRWWDRLAGQRTINDSPTETQRKLIAETITSLADRNNITPDQAQATIWDREKNIWRTAGLRDPGDLDFAQAAKLVIANRKASIPKGIAAIDAMLNPTEAAPKLSKAVEEITAHFKDKYGAATPEKVLARSDAISKSYGSWQRPYWMDHDGNLYGPVEMHGPSMQNGMKKARIGLDAIGYKGADTRNFEQEWVHGGLQLGFTRVNVSPNEISAQTHTALTPAQTRALAVLQRGKTFFGSVVNYDGSKENYAEGWTPFRRLMNEEGGK